MSEISIAVLLTSYNRREDTLACLKAVFSQELDVGVRIQVYLVDDGSTDGTSDAVQASYPEVRLIKGNGSLFWNGGMRLAFAVALETGHDYYLWLNDDTMLRSNAVGNLLSAHNYLASHGKADSIVVGQAQDPATGVLTYGGVVRASRWSSFKFKWLEVNGDLQQCDTMDGNCVLVPREVAELVGNLDEAFIHAHGDWDYGLRACKLGCSVWVTPEYVGTCIRNPIYDNWMSIDLPLSERLKKLKDPKGVTPHEWKVLTRRHAGRFWFLHWLSPFIYLFIGPTLKKIRRQK